MGGGGGQNYFQLRARKERTKINLLGPETAVWGGGLPRDRVGVEKLVPSLESVFSFFEAMPRTAGGVQKVRGKVRAHSRLLSEAYHCISSTSMLSVSLVVFFPSLEMKFPCHTCSLFRDKRR